MLPDKITGYHTEFIELNDENHSVTSPQTNIYNCIAWAVGEDGVWWWPDSTHQAFWPEDVKREVTVEAFAEAFISLGYELCDDGDYEADFQKIVLYVSAFFAPTHAAKQLDERLWSSKLGKSFDIEHELNALNSKTYGSPKVFFKKRVL
jgi:hypothetical protein